MWYNHHHHNVRHHKDNQYDHHVNPHDPTGRYDPSLAVRQLLETGQYNLLASLATGWTIIISITIIWLSSYNHHEITLLQCEGLSKKLVEDWRFTYNRLSSTTITITTPSLASGKICQFDSITDIIRLPVTVLAILSLTFRVSLLHTGIFDCDADADDG